MSGPHSAVRLAVVVLLGAVASLQPRPALAQAAAPRDATTEARALFGDYWQWTMREFPEFATFVGDHRYDDRLADFSPSALARRRAARAQFLERAVGIDGGSLDATDRVSLRVFRYQLEQAAALDKLCAPVPCGYDGFWSPVTQFYGPQFDVPQLVDATRFASTADYDAYVKRLDGLPAQLDQVVALMEVAMSRGWMPAKVAIARVPGQLDAQLDPDPAKSPEYAPFKSFPKEVSPSDRERLVAAGRRAIEQKVIPAFRRLHDFYEQRYLPKASTSIAASSLPPGLPYYESRLELNTTTRMSAQEIHDLGLSEVKRIAAEMEATIAAAGFKGTRAEFQKFLHTDPRFFYTKAEDLLAGYRDIAKRADAQLPRLFAELPRQPYGVRAMRPEEGENADHYIPGAADGSRAGYFEANVNALSRRPKWEMETTLLHEAVPGHHLQFARSQEMKSLPDFRRNGWFVAYGEGWALYAESLGYEMGFYADPYYRFGNLAAEMLRSARLVVDTGIHAFGWSRERAIAYLQENAALTPEFAAAETDRYIVMPGQATAYKIGELRIVALRAKARAELGDKFDLRRFNNAVIDNGALPLDVLDQQIADWIAAERVRTR